MGYRSVNIRQVAPQTRALLAGLAQHPWRHRSKVLWTYLFGDATDWSAANGTVSDETGLYVTGDQSIKLTSSGASPVAQADMGLSATQNLQDGILHLRFMIPGADEPTVNSVQVLLRSGGNWGNYNVYGFDCASSEVRSGIDLWYDGYACTNDPRSGSVGSLDLTAVDMVRIKLYLASAVAGKRVYLDQFTVREHLARPVYLMTFDDGRDDQLTTARWLAERDLPGTFYVVTDQVGASGRLTWDQLHEIQEQMGVTIANHSRTHAYWRHEGLTHAQKIDEILSASERLAHEGFAEGARHFAIPGGYDNLPLDEDIRKTILGRYVDSFRITDGVGEISDPRTWLNTVRKDDASGMDAILDSAVAKGGNGVILSLFHNGEQSGLETHLDNVAAKRDAGQIDVVSVPDLVRGVW